MLTFEAHDVDRLRSNLFSDGTATVDLYIADGAELPSEGDRVTLTDLEDAFAAGTEVEAVVTDVFVRSTSFRLGHRSVLLSLSQG